ncbi:hypothetical protein FRC00_005839, partial [Tulasnella sp. 408]
MATPEEIQLLEFSGKDSDELEQFISAVLKHAFAQDKQRDDAWIAKFTATCLAEDALRWWMGLDKKTQKSWNLLRRAMALEYQPLFRGESGQEAEKFVQTVNRRAREAGKQGDNRWIMEFVSTSLAGNALTWYSSLDRSVRAEWVLFQKATFAQYPREDGLDSPPSKFSIIPTPAAAGPITRPPNGTKRGRIRLFTESGFVQYYISKKLTTYGFFCVTNSLDDALEVEHDGNPKDLKPLSIRQ